MLPSIAQAQLTEQYPKKYDKNLYNIRRKDNGAENQNVTLTPPGEYLSAGILWYESDNGI